MTKLFLAAALIALATPALAQNAPLAGQQAALSAATTKFVTDAAMTDMFEIRAGHLAVKKADDPAYQDFAQMTLLDHAKTSGELKAMLSQLPGFQRPQELDAARRAALDKLSRLSGTAFESAYKADQMQGHKQAVAMFERYAAGGDNPDLKKWASATLPTLRKHLMHAEVLPQAGQAPTTGSGQRR